MFKPVGEGAQQYKADRIYSAHNYSHYNIYIPLFETEILNAGRASGSGSNQSVRHYIIATQRHSERVRGECRHPCISPIAAGREFVPQHVELRACGVADFTG